MPPKQRSTPSKRSSKKTADDAGPAAGPAADPPADDPDVDVIPAKKAKKPQSYDKKGQPRYKEHSRAFQEGRKAALAHYYPDPKSLSPYENPDFHSDTEPEDEPTDAAAPPEPKDTFVAPLPGTSAPRTPRKSPRKQSTPKKQPPSTIPAAQASPIPVRRSLSTDSDGSPRRLPGQEVPFNKQEEDDLAKWVEANRTLYNNSTATPKGRQQKAELLARQAVKMNCTPLQIKEWIDKFRQYYVKLKRTKVGVPQQSLTEKQAWTLSRGTFFDPYIKQATKSSGQDTDSDDSLVSQPGASHSPSASSGIYVPHQMQDKTNPREGFQFFLGYKFTEIPDNLWYSFEQDCLGLITRYREAGRQQQQGQPPQQLWNPQQQQGTPQQQQLQPQPQQLQPQPQQLQPQQYVQLLSPTGLVQGSSPMKQQTQPQRSSAPSASGVFGQSPFQGSSFQ